jgi:hypothetical protein
MKKVIDQNDEMKLEIESLKSQLKVERKKSEKMKKLLQTHNIAINDVWVFDL